MSRNSDDPSDRPGTSKRGSEAPGPGLYVVGTPIGNLGDITRRATEILAGVDIVACEDTRVARRLFSALGLAAKRLIRYDDHAGEAERHQLVEALRQGKSVALISDAGMPLVADPGLKLVRAVREAGLRVTVIPGPSAALTALAASGLPSDRFLFTGFLPAKEGARRRALAEIAAVPATLIFFESPQRLADSLSAMSEVLGARDAAVARELTKLFEEIRHGTLQELAAHYAAAGAPKGEIVVVVGPPKEEEATVTDDADLDEQLSSALATMSLRDAVAAIAAVTGRKRAEVYARALALRKPGAGT